MKLAQFKARNIEHPRLGVLEGDVIADVTEAAGDMLTVIHRGTGAVGALSKSSTATRYALGEVKFLPAVHPTKIVAIGRNYHDHAIEGGSEPPPAPLIFTKLPNSLTAHGAPIVLPSIAKQVDFEAELAVVIGKRATRVSESEALEHVFGYTLIHDVSARDLQFGDGQWVRGKGLDTFAPLGPFITTRDEIDDVHNLKIEGILNGTVMQSSNTSKMIFKVPYLIHYISQAITLEPGDVIATGTPDGVGIFRKPPILLKPGDVFDVVIENLGTLSNPVEQGE